MLGTLGLYLQVAGLVILPFALVVGFTAEHGMLAEFWLLGIGTAIFFAGHFLRKRG